MSVRTWEMHLAGLLLLSLPACGQPGATNGSGSPQDRVELLSAQFWQWRATEQPFSDDDIPRLERPAGFVERWGAADIAGYRQRITDFEHDWRTLDASDNIGRATVSTQVDWRLIGSAIARVRWELEVLPQWRRNPEFYVDQSLGAVYQAMLPPPPFTKERQADVLLRLEGVPRLLEEGKANLTDMRRPYATVAMGNLDGIEAAMRAFHDGVHATGILSPQTTRFDAAQAQATKALVAYREWLRPQVAGMKTETAVGRTGYEYFLRNVALLPYTPEQMLAVGETEFARAVSFEALQQAANTGLPQTPLYPSLAAEIADEQKRELFLRRYLKDHGLLSEPAAVQHYTYAAIPPYLAALSFLGVTDDLTGPSRLASNGTSYKSPPRDGMPFFDAITARDVRPLTLHEGVPGHYYQLAWSWHDPDSVRRHFYDSQSNEGIGFYAEEMMLIGGLFDQTPRTKEAIYSMMRLRALRVVVDVKLALGDFTLERAAEYLQKTVPMDRATARDEAAAFATGPGQAITYQIGKYDILRLIAEAREKDGSAFNLERFHDFVWQNGNVPFSLQRWELLGAKDRVPPIPDTFAWTK